ncbi:hypothetical protein [Bordetella sp. FB-8]|uniref:hypothetical protein n=1 Tax=Bordetella sp. FB-8 TaxID=1159870 RepID=UPI000365623E|nr:hypothetical protein [Bordetella sp. FB-8]
MKRIFPRFSLVRFAALVLCCCAPALALAAPTVHGTVSPDAYQWQPVSQTAVNVTGSLQLEMTDVDGKAAAGGGPIAMRFGRLGRIPVQFVGAFDAASVAPATAWVVNLDKPQVMLSCGANPVKAFVIESEPSHEGASANAGRLNLYGLDQKMATVPNIKNLPTACFLAVYLHR